MPTVPDPKKVEAYNKDAKEAFSRVERRALENYLAELVKGLGLEYDRLQENHGLKAERWLLLDVEVRGEFPDTYLAMKYRRGAQGDEGWQSTPIWKDPTFFDSDFKPRVEVPDMAVDILMNFRGG